VLKFKAEPVGGTHVLDVHLPAQQKEPGVEVGQMLVVRKGEAVFLLATQFEKRGFFSQFYGYVLPVVRAFQNLHGEKDARRLRVLKIFTKRLSSPQ
jgi:hypothetical protein